MFLVGENGSRKSKLIEVLAVGSGLNGEGGGISFRFSMRVALAAEHLRFTRSPRRVRIVISCARKATSPGNQHRRAGLPACAGSEDHQCLRWQAALRTIAWPVLPRPVLNRFRGDGLYFLDEPEAALPLTRQMELLARMHQLAQAGSQFIIATHSPILMAYPGTVILGLDGTGLAPIAYQDTAHADPDGADAGDTV